MNPDYVYNTYAENIWGSVVLETMRSGASAAAAAKAADDVIAAFNATFNKKSES